METLVLIVIVIAGFAAVLLLLLRSKPADQESLLNRLYEKNEELRDKQGKELHGNVKEMLEGNQKQIDLIVRQLKDQLGDSQRDVRSLKEQNAALQQALKNTTELTKELKVSTDSLQSLLSNNRLRGEWGEQVAEDLLLGAGFVENVNFTKQKSTGTSRPDFTILLPDGTKLNVDAKFPFDDLVAYQSAEAATDKKRALKNFSDSVRNKVKQITTRDYINPEQNTVDFVVMFIPNEMIFSFIYEKLPEMIAYTNERKVIMTGPYGFTALIRLVLQAHRNFRYEKGLQHILGLIENFQAEYLKFGEKMGSLGRQIETTRQTFSEVEGVRSRQLTKLVERIGDYSEQEKLLNSEQLLEEDKE